MKFSRLESIVIIFLVVILVFAIVFSPKGTYVKDNSDNENNLPEEIAPPIEEPALPDEEQQTAETNEKSGKGNQPKDAPLVENDFTFEKLSFVATVIEETSEYMIVEPSEGEEERSKSDRINIVYPQKHDDYIYGIGRRVIIQYSLPMVKQAPYFEIKTDDILTDGYENFEIHVEPSETKSKVLVYTADDIDAFDGFADGNKSDFYYYGTMQVNVTVNGETMPIYEALSKGYITLNGILKKCNIGVSEGTVTETRYDDGGSVLFNFEDYSVIKYHTIGEPGNSDVYIGTTDMDINVCNLKTDMPLVVRTHCIPYEDPWGLTLNVEDALNGVSYYFTQNGGNPTGELMYGSDYTVEKLVDGKWIKVPYIVDNVAWTSEAYYIPQNSNTEKKIVSFEHLYGELRNGRYRFGKSVMDFRKTGDFDQKMYYGYFDIN